MSRPRLPLGHAARVAAVTTALIAVVYVAAAGVLDLVVVGRLTGQVDARLTAALVAGPPETGPAGEARSAHGDLDDAPVLRWSVTEGGLATGLTPGAPALPRRSWSGSDAVTIPLDGSSFRLEARPAPGGGWLVAGQSLAQAHHIRAVLLAAEALVAPVVLLAVYLGALAIGLKAAAPIERTRRRQLEFTADASHELRTPLSVIEAEIGLALSGTRDAGYYRGTIERVGGESRRLRRIVDDLLWLARFDAEPPPPGDEPVDLATIAAACAERFGAVAAAGDLRLEVRDAGPTPALIKAPPEWVDRLFGVLVDNACRYSPPGGALTVTVGTAGPRAYLVVEDEGPGIPEEQRDRLFDRFHRATDQDGGAGLGLAIADAVVRSTAGRWRIGTGRTGGARMEVSWHRAGGPERRGPGPSASSPDQPLRPKADVDAR